MLFAYNLQSGKEELNESRRVGGSRSSNEEDKYERYSTERSSPCGKTNDRSSKCYYDERRSPRYSREYIRHGSYKQSPVRFEIVDDRIWVDRFGNNRFSPGDSKLQRRLPNTNDKNADSSCSPVARPLQEILGDNVPTLQVGEISKEKHGEHADGFAHNQASSCYNAKYMCKALFFCSFLNCITIFLFIDLLI